MNKKSTPKHKPNLPSSPIGAKIPSHSDRVLMARGDLANTSGMQTNSNSGPGSRRVKVVTMTQGDALAVYLASQVPISERGGKDDPLEILEDAVNEQRRQLKALQKSEKKSSVTRRSR